LNDDSQTGTGVQLRRERIVEQPPMTALALEVHAGHVQSAVADVTDGNGAICATAGVHAAKDSGAGYGEPPGGRVAFNLNHMRRGWIGTDNRDFRGLLTKTGWPKADWNRKKIASRNDERIGKHFGRLKLGG